MAVDGLAHLTEDECWRFVEHRHLGRVGVIEFHRRPLVYPVNYVIHRRSVIFRTTPGTKLVAASLGAHAVIEVDEIDENSHSGTSVMVHGTLHEVTEPAERERLRAVGVHPWAPGDRDHFVRLEPERVSGRRIPPTVPGDGLGADAG
ncbi:MAG TPA: pyridoxamine 5'-phosphate oxidase family protein [Acidimicrobiales bacterium]|nr:pyridoxamine 5'-phosphate oxidase family protein [Acidimicrobiales bacterium]